MKSQGILIIIMLVVSCSVTYSHNVSRQGYSGDMEGKTNKIIKSSIAISKQLNHIAVLSTQISSGLSENDTVKVKELARAVMSNLFKFNEEIIRNKSNSSWYYRKVKLILSIRKVFSSETIKNQRIYFDDFNRELYRSIISYGLEKGKFYYLGCLKAFPNGSGYWFSQNPVIVNPYVTTRHPNCGFIAEKLR